MNDDWKTFWECALSVAMNTCGRKRPKDFEGSELVVAAYLTRLINFATDNQGNYMVDAIPYSRSTKFPLIITNGVSHMGLFWYYPYWTDEQLCEHLAERLVELSDEPLDVAAFAGGRLCAHLID